MVDLVKVVLFEDFVKMDNIIWCNFIGCVDVLEIFLYVYEMKKKISVMCLLLFKYFFIGC